MEPSAVEVFLVTAAVLFAVKDLESFYSTSTAAYCSLVICAATIIGAAAAAKGNIRPFGLTKTIYRNEKTTDSGALYGVFLIPLVLFTASASDVGYLGDFAAISILFSCWTVFELLLPDSLGAFIPFPTILLNSFLLTVAYLVMLSCTVLFEEVNYNLSIAKAYLSLMAYNEALYGATALFSESFTFGEIAVITQTLVLVLIRTVTLSGAASNGALLHSILFEGAVLGTLFLSAAVSLVARILLINDIDMKNLYFIYAAAALASLTVLLWMDYQLQQSAFLSVLGYLAESWTRILLCVYWVAMIYGSVCFASKIYYNRQQKKNDETSSEELNLKRKFFHFLAVFMFIPGYIYEPIFMHMAFSVAFAAYVISEIVRIHRMLPPYDKVMERFLSQFLDYKDSGKLIVSHAYLLVGYAVPVWLEAKEKATLAGLSGILAVGVGDTMVALAINALQASLVGYRFGRIKWTTGNKKTVEGTVAFVVSVLLAAELLCWLFPSAALHENVDWTKYSAGVFLIGIFKTNSSALWEAFSMQNDNLIAPVMLYAATLIASR